MKDDSLGRPDPRVSKFCEETLDQRQNGVGQITGPIPAVGVTQMATVFGPDQDLLGVVNRDTLRQKWDWSLYRQHDTPCVAQVTDAA
jgi:hypothetical protein